MLDELAESDPAVNPSSSLSYPCQHFWTLVPRSVRKKDPDYTTFFDIQAYKSFLSKVQQESRIVQSGLTLAFPKEREGIFINICQSQALKAPSSLSLNQADVPVLVSPSRPFKPGSGTITHFECTSECLSLNLPRYALDNRLVFDVVYHNSVLEECLRNPPYLKAIVELSLDCLDELYQIKLKGCHYDLTKESYVGPYAWGTQQLY